MYTIKLSAGWDAPAKLLSCNQMLGECIYLIATGKERDKDMRDGIILRLIDLSISYGISILHATDGISSISIPIDMLAYH